MEPLRFIVLGTEDSNPSKDIKGNDRSNSISRQAWESAPDSGENLGRPEGEIAVGSWGRSDGSANLTYRWRPPSINRC